MVCTHTHTQHMHSYSLQSSTIPSVILPAQLATKMRKLHLSTNKCAAALCYGLIPRPFKRRRRKGLVHIVRACAGGLQKNVGEVDTIIYSPYIVHRTVRHVVPTNDHYGNVTSRYRDPNACVLTQCVPGSFFSSS